MQPIRTTKTARLRRLIMYREDLEQFVAFFQNTCDDVTISDNKNRYDSLDEMQSVIGSKIKDLDIRGENPGVHFLLNRKEYPQGSQTVAVFNELRTEEVSDAADNLFLKVQEFLRERQRPWVRWPFAILAVFAFGCTIVSFGRDKSDPGKAPWATLIFAIALAAFAIPALKLGNIITLDKRAASQTFWSRNREAFATHTVTAAISAIIGGVVGWFFGHFLK